MRKNKLHLINLIVHSDKWPMIWQFSKEQMLTNLLQCDSVGILREPFQAVWINLNVLL